MKASQAITSSLAVLMAVSLATAAWAKPPKMKMTTDIPESITIPNVVETRLGTLRFEDGFRLYGPEQAWFDKTWRPGEIELVKRQ